MIPAPADAAVDNEDDFDDVEETFDYQIFITHCVNW